MSAVLDYLAAERTRGNDDGIEAHAIRDAVGGSHGGRSVAGELGRLVRAGDVETVPRTDGRARPYLYRRRVGAWDVACAGRVEVTIVLTLGSDQRLDDGTIAVAIEELLQGSPLIVGGMRSVVEVAHAEVVEIGRAAP
jgi:hypothetical protein